LQHKTIPPTIHYESPNQEIPFKDTPFYVNQKALYWKEADGPRRAGAVSYTHSPSPRDPLHDLVFRLVLVKRGGGGGGGGGGG
ncbi:hypothetical protein ACQ4LK_25835, partial [Bacillus pumilus]